MAATTSKVDQSGAAQLHELAEATACLENEATIVDLVGRTLTNLLPQCFVKTYTLRGFPARAVGFAKHFFSQQEYPEHPACRAQFSQRLLPIIRAANNKTGAWIEVVRGGILPLAALKQEFADPKAAVALDVKEWGFLTAALGAEPVAGASFLLPARERGLTDSQRSQLRLLQPLLTQPLRVAALLANGSAGLYAFEHLLASRTDVVFLLSPGGHVLAASPRGERAMHRHPRLQEALQHAVRRARARASAVVVPDLGAEIHVGPCSARGSAPAYLAIASATPGGRRRLSPRQTELLDFLSEGHTNFGIARQMNIATSTVKTMLETMYRRAGVRNRVALLAWARGSDAIKWPLSTSGGSAS